MLALPADDLPSRIVIQDLDIDLAVVPGDLVLPGNPSDYPLCDVAQYLTTYRYPGRLGTTTWIYAHAREDMFLKLLEASELDNGVSLIDQLVRLYTDGALLYTYRVTSVERHATDRSSANGVDPEEGRLVLQTSEGPRGTVAKLQVVSSLVSIEPSTTAESRPTADPMVCDAP